MANRWEWEIFLQDTGGGESYLDWMFSAWGWTLAVAGSAWVLALLVGALIGTMRTTPNKVFQAIGYVWVELFRNIPLLVQIFIWYHVVPSLFPALRQFPSFLLVVMALGFFTSARVAEQVRSGIETLPRGQRMAGLALGLSLPQTYRHVILPMAFRIVIPPLTSEAMNIIKNSAVAFAVSISELTLFAMQAQEETARGVEIYLGVTALYVVSAFGVNRLMSLIERSVRIPGTIGSK